MWRTESVFRISRKIIIETSLKHLMFVHKHQAILNTFGLVVDEFPEHIPQAYLHLESRGWFSEYCNQEQPSSLKFKLRSFYVGLSVFTKIWTYRISGMTTTLSTSPQKPKFLNNYQTFFKEVDENSLKTFTGWVASHAGVFRRARPSSLPTNACWTEDSIPFPSLANHIVLSKFWKVDLDRKVIW